MAVATTVCIQNRLLLGLSQVERLQAEVAELRRQLHVTSAQRDIISPANAATQEVSKSLSALHCVALHCSEQIRHYSLNNLQALRAKLGGSCACSSAHKKTRLCHGRRAERRQRG